MSQRARRDSEEAFSGGQFHYPPDLKIEPLHMDVCLSFDLPARRAWGSVTHRFKARVGGVQSCALNAVDMRGVSVESLGSVSVSHRYDGLQLEIDWETPFEVGEERSVRIAYSVEDPVTGITFSMPDEAYPDRPRAAYTDNETERARYWLPCVDLPHARTTFSFELTASQELTILANGVEAGATVHEDGSQTVRWELAQRCPSYLVCIAIGDFVRHDAGEVDGVPMAWFALPPFSSADLERSFGPTETMMRWLTTRLDAPFPHAKYFQVALPRIGGAMENNSLVAWDVDALVDETMTADQRGALDATNIHEMAHAYFGNSLVIRDYAHAWLKESWATYIESCWLGETQGIDEQSYDLFLNADLYFRESDQSYSRSIMLRNFVTSWQIFDRHLYPGGAWRIHMLRCLLGDEVFWPATCEYVRRFTEKVVETIDFQRVLEEYSGRSLGRFFDQWLGGSGYPHLKVSFAHADGYGTWTIVQKQMAEDATAGSGFHFSLEVGWEDSTGEFHRKSAEVEGTRRNVVSVAMAEAPRQVRVDPRQRLLAKIDFDAGRPMLARQMTHAPDVPGRILAARELIKGGRRSNFEVVAKALSEENHWGVKRQIMVALGKSASVHAIPILAQRLAEERDSRVLETVAGACAQYRDARIEVALLSHLDRSDIGYGARAAGLAALGSQRGDKHIERLIEASRDDGWMGIVRRGAIRGLALTRSPQAMAELQGRIAYGTEPDVTRDVVVASQASLFLWTDKPLRRPTEERLVELTRDPRLEVRMAAARALVNLDARSAIPALEALKGTVADQEWPEVDGWIATLRKSGGGADSAKQREEIKELRRTVRGLEERLSGLEAKANSRDGSPGKS